MGLEVVPRADQKNSSAIHNSPSAHEINNHHSAAKWSRKMQWPGNGRAQQKRFASTGNSSGHGHMQPDATWHVCATSTHLEAARA
jgi:hypothetical protein